MHMSMITAVRLALAGAYLLLLFHPASPVFGALLLSLPCFLAAVGVVEFGYYHWCGGDRLRLARALYRNGALADAEACLEELITRNRQPWITARAAALLAWIEIENGRFAEASGHSRLARDVCGSPDAKANHLLLEGMVSHVLGQPREAASRLDSAQALRPSRPLQGMIHLVRAALFQYHEHNPRKALTHLQRAAGCQGHPLTARHLPAVTALALAEADRTDDARDLLAQVPRDVAMRSFVEGRIHHIEGDFRGAANAYSVALERLDDAYLLYRALCRYHLGTALIELDQVRTGSRFLQQALRSSLPKIYRQAIPQQLELARDEPPPSPTNTSHGPTAT